MVRSERRMGSRRVSVPIPDGARVRLFVTVLCVAALGALTAGCGGNGGGSESARFQGSGASGAPGLVHLTGSSLGGDLVQVNVVIGGPTSGADIFAFHFDVVVGDPTVAVFTGKYEVGDALFPMPIPSPGHGTEQIVGQATTDADNVARVSVGVTKMPQGPGNDIPAGHKTIIKLVYRLLRSGQTSIALAGTSGNSSEPPAALDSQTVVVSQVTFDLRNATLAK